MSEESPKNDEVVAPVEENPDQEDGEGEAECPEGTTVTLQDVMEIQDELVNDAAAILGAASDKKCSYAEGYLKRQALYSCLTCIPEAKDDPEKAGGVCLACSFHCHEGHNLIELYTKRNFRCDCGNSKFAASGNKCSLLEDKTDTNELNCYNQNFSGTYCVCHRPYPDLDDPIPDEMIQCIICEDWYHSRHLGVEVPEDNFAEMTCELCVTKLEFMLHYDALAYRGSSMNTSRDIDVDVEENNAGNEGQECKRPKNRSDRATAKFWHEYTWREQLCTCDECLKMYENEDVAFLLDQEDPVHLYEEKSKAKAKAFAENQNQQMMNSVDRVAMIETIIGFNDLKDNLIDYLKKFAENKKVVREEDIKEFFQGMEARKKAKVDHVQHNCR
ncbi:unnamed protein product [Ceutorhynchus assimilis]|uniref:UBR-type domain-containing protein n=1 Tax=Ceutorhynchus assimilis TaxID=467358 RepID=A0A9N9MN63_9CUCU|nr:unnamed protein product [Ceutorhynchus assimilis]